MGNRQKQSIKITTKLLCLLLSLLCAAALSGCGRTVLTGDDLEEMWRQEAAQAEADKEAAAAADEPILSLRERGLEQAVLYLDGPAYVGLRLGDGLWCDCSDLEEAFPGFHWQAAEDRLILTDADGHQAAVDCRLLGPNDVPQAGDAGLILQRADGSAAECWVTLDQLTAALSFRSLCDGDNGTYYLSPSVDTSLIPSGRSVPVLMYHGVSNEPWGLEGLFMAPESLRQHLRFFRENGYDLLFFSDLTHLDDYDKPVLLTFDDGYLDNYSQLFPILQEFQAKATVFMIAHNVDYNPNFMTGSQIKELADSGLVDMQSHTVNHQELASMSPEQQRAEMRDSQLMLARITGKIPYVLSYPAGKYNDDTERIAPEYYDFGLKSRGGLWTVDDNFFTIDRYPVYRGAGAGDLQYMLP